MGLLKSNFLGISFESHDIVGGAYDNSICVYVLKSGMQFVDMEI